MTESGYVGTAFGDEPLADRLPDPQFLTPDHAMLHFEVRQLEDGGRHVDSIEPDLQRAFERDPDDPALESAVESLLDRGVELPMREEYPYDEPTALSAIQEVSPDQGTGEGAVDDATARSAIHGGWLGACAGCLLGKPVQGWTRARIREYLQASDQWPLTEYIHGDVDPAIADRYAIHTNLEEGHVFIDDVEGMPIDDDIDYIVVGLRVLEAHGTAFAPSDVGNEWLEQLPLFNTYTAERVAYRNLTNRIEPPRTATHRNPYREMVGALIRADPWGWAALGDPGRAAALAHRDARISHTRNGVYGEMWAAAMIAAAPVVTDIDELLDAGMGQIPPKSRLAESVRTVREWHAAGVDVTTAVDRIHDRWEETEIYDWVHTLSNAEVITVALSWSDGDLGDALTTAVTAGFDTDSHAATIGSILGTYHGAASLPGRFVDPLEDTVDTSVADEGRNAISDLADRTYAVWSSAMDA